MAGWQTPNIRSITIKLCQPTKEAISALFAKVDADAALNVLCNLRGGLIPGEEGTCFIGNYFIDR